jgi:phosphoglycolate phosphatase
MSQFLAVFDWNGTLLDDAAATLAGHNAALNFFGKPPTDLATFRSLEHIPLSRMFYQFGVEIDTYLANFEASLDAYRTAYRGYWAEHGMQLRKGTLPLLDWLESQGAVLTVLSNHVQDKLDAELREFGLYDRFAAISGNASSEALASSLSKLERYGEMLNQFGFDPKDSFIIGDTPEELRAATHHGSIGVAIANGIGSVELLQAHQPGILIEELTELPEALANRWHFLTRPVNFAA